MRRRLHCRPPGRQRVLLFDSRREVSLLQLWHSVRERPPSGRWHVCASCLRMIVQTRAESSSLRLYRVAREKEAKPQNVRLEGGISYINPFINPLSHFLFFFRLRTYVHTGVQKSPWEVFVGQSFSANQENR